MLLRIGSNALRLDWLDICPPTGKTAKIKADDLFDKTQAQAEIDFTNQGGETYICGNPPYLGSTWQDAEQKEDLRRVLGPYTRSYKSLDYVAGWFLKAAEYGQHTPTASAFVSTNSICQGQQVPILWPILFDRLSHRIFFAHTSFKWANLASHNAGVTTVIVGISNQNQSQARLFELDERGQARESQVAQINAYLVKGANVIVRRAAKPLTEVSEMSFGNKPVDGGHLLLTSAEVTALGLSPDQRKRFVRRIYGSAEFIRGLLRYCLWIEDQHLEEALAIPAIAKRVEGVRQMRLASKDKGANALAARAHQMREMKEGAVSTIIVGRTTSESRSFLPSGLLDAKSVASSEAFTIFDVELWNLGLLSSRLHWVWIATVCGQLETRIRYSNTLGWNTFPIPALTEKQRADLTRCAETILLAREAHFSATIADLYDAKKGMPDNLRAAHEANDETLERIYIGRRFKNDTERLEHLFQRYTDMTAKAPESAS